MGVHVFPFEPTSHLPPHPIPQGHPSAPALSTLSHASNLDWLSISHMVTYMFQCYAFKSSHPRLLSKSPKVCSLYLHLFCCLAYRVIITIFLNSIYMRLVYCLKFFLNVFIFNWRIIALDSPAPCVVQQPPTSHLFGTW